MAIALGATGYFMAINVPTTPRAVVVCVVIYNAFFGYRYSQPSSAMYGLLRGVQKLGTDSMALPTRDHASDCQSEGCIAVNCNKLVLQFHRWACHPIFARGH